MAAQDFELILRVQADLKTAVGELRTLNDQMRVVKSSAQEASGGLQSLTSALKSLGSNAASIGGQLRTLAGAVASLVAIRELASFVKDVIDADQAVGDMAQKVGVSTEALSALGSVAKRNGSDLQGVQQAFVNLARAGTGLNQTGVRALQAMNINLKEFQALKPEQQFDLVAQKFAGYSDGANKAALATALFGKSGADLIPTLNEVGQQGLQSVTDKAIAAGTAIGGDAVRASQAFSNALQTLKEKLAGAVNEGLVQFTPEIEQLVELMDDPNFQKNLAAVAGGIVEIGKAAIDAANNFVTLTRNYAEYVAKVQNGAGGDDVAGMKLEQSDIQDELKQRQAHPILSHINSFLAGTENNVVQNALEGGRPRIQSMSTADLQKRLTQLDQDILHAAVAKTAATSPNPQEGDTRRLVVDKGQTQAPIVPGTGGGGSDQTNKLIQDAAASQNALTQALIAQQAALSPTAAAWAAYNKAAQNADDEAAKGNTALRALAAAHKISAAAAEQGIAANNAMAQAVKDGAAAVRDAALDKLAEADKKAWQDLTDSLRTPVQVHVDDAIAKINALVAAYNKLQGTAGAPTSQQLDQAIGQVVDQSLPQRPNLPSLNQRRGSGLPGLQQFNQANADANTENNFYGAQQDASQQLAAAELSKFAGNKEKELQIAQEYDARFEAQAKTHAQIMQQIKTAQFQGELTMTTGVLDQLATLSQSGNRKVAAVGKAAAIASAIIKTYENATTAYGEGLVAGGPYAGPVLGAVYAAVAIAAGLANVAAIRAQPTGGSYAAGGAIRGPGTGTSDSIPIMASNGEFMQRAAAVQHYGVGFMDDINNMRLPKFADGGLVHPLANAPTPSQMGFAAPSLPRADFSKLSAANDDAGSAKPQVGVRIVNVVDPKLILDVMASSAGEKVFVNHISHNQAKMKAVVGS